MTSLIPERLLADYEPLSLLKNGPQRQTLLLRHRSSHCLAVLKRCSDEQEDLAAEYDLLCRLEGKGLPAPLETFREGGCAYLLREYISGEPLLDYAQKHGPLPTREVCGIGLSLCRTLKRLHSQNPPVIHRDIKLENIIRTPSGDCVLIDLGIARQYDAQARRDTQVLGTPGNAPPEQFGYRQTDPRSDVYALGIVLHELGSGEPRLDRGTLDPALQALVDRCTRFDPTDRYADAAEVERALLGLGRPQEKNTRLFWKAPLLAAVLGAAVLGAAVLGAAVLGAAVWLGWSASRPAPAFTPSPVSTPAPVIEPADEPSPETYSFASSAIEAEVCRQLGKEPGTVTAEELEQIETLILCGDQWGTEWERLSVAGDHLYLNDTEVTGMGTIDTLEDLPGMKNLHTLALCNQRIQDLSPLTQCRQLRRLALHGNRITDLSTLADSSELQELIASDNPLSDFSPLAACPYLWSVDASATALVSLDSFALFPSLNRLYVRNAAGLQDIGGLKDTPVSTLFLQPVTQEQLAVLGGLAQIHSLFLWEVEGMENLSPLSGMERLEYLYIDSNSINSLDGAEALANVFFLDIRTNQTVDLHPLSKMDKLTTITAFGLFPEDWAALGDIPNLSQVNCTVEQADAIQDALGEVSFQLNS